MAFVVEIVEDSEVLAAFAVANLVGSSDSGLRLAVLVVETSAVEPEVVMA